ncbi:hypothetical protein DRJ48_00945 [Candidatus Woesearchaeota archaeon]|nr:hypothetical protein [Candidatus Woesearchaeota archaeon]RLE43438.1 MAG: hypothetical protein DRJ48_00945 [Candidatus Woesearchaeota archaeon]
MDTPKLDAEKQLACGLVTRPNLEAIIDDSQQVTTRGIKTATNALGKVVDLSSAILFRASDNYTFTPEYQLRAYVFDPGITWEDYTAEFGPRFAYTALGYIIPSEKRGARNPYVWQDIGSVTSHEVRHYQHYLSNSISPDEERRTRYEERVMGWGNDYTVRL